MRVENIFLAGVALIASAALTSAGPGAGAIEGKVTYEGIPPKQKPIDMSKEPSCAQQHAAPLAPETVVTGPNSALDNVVVYISAGSPDDPAPSQAVTFTQKGCQFLPHVLAFQVNQELKIVNDDQTAHNVHPIAKLNPEWNKFQLPGTPPIVDKYSRMEFIPVKCNVHPWMRGILAVLKNSHYAISRGDGRFKLPNLPPGKYAVTAWHESCGEQTQEVTIAGSETKTLNFVFKAKPY